jgi:hypothetical protein
VGLVDVVFIYIEQKLKHIFKRFKEGKHLEIDRHSHQGSEIKTLSYITKILEKKPFCDQGFHVLALFPRLDYFIQGSPN